MLTKKKRRFGHGMFSSSPSSNSSSTKTVTASAMGALEHPQPSTSGAPHETQHNGNGNTEPLLEGLDQIYDERHAPVQHVQAALGKPPELKPKSPQRFVAHQDASASPPPDFTRRGIHIPTRTSSNTASVKQRLFSRSSSLPPAPNTASSDSGSQHENGVKSSGASVRSYETQATSIHTQNLAPLQAKGAAEDMDRLSPLLEDDPQSYNLIAPNEGTTAKGFDLENRSQQLFSREHLKAIFQDTPSLLRFTSFLSTARPQAVPMLIYYLDALKAVRAIQYANAVAEALDPIDGHEFTETGARPTLNAVLEDKAERAFDVLVRDELPAFITHVYVQLVSVSIQKRVTGNLPPMLRDASEGLAEVFCVSDPSRTDNPIIFASEEFHRTTQYGVNFAIGRNCRFLQGPMTNRNSVTRLRKAIADAKEVSEVFLNYRRDGSPFMNLLMMAPLLDSRGNLRYFIGAQVDVSGLVQDCTGLDAFKNYIDIKEGRAAENEPKDEFQELSEMFNTSELDMVKRYGGSMHKEHVIEEEDGNRSRAVQRPRLLIKDSGNFDSTPLASATAEGRLAGVYKHYLLIRPAPSLRILFVSPSLRVPGILQSRFLDRIGGNTRVRNSVAEALSDSSRGVTAKVRWLSTATANLDSHHEEGRPRWIHCTPLLGPSGAVGVWMVVLVDDEKQSSTARRFRPPPPVASDLGRGRGSPDPYGWEGNHERGATSKRHSMEGDAAFQLPVGGRRSGSAMSGQRADPGLRVMGSHNASRTSVLTQELG